LSPRDSFNRTSVRIPIVKGSKRPPEPADFDRRARSPGNAWLNVYLDAEGRLPRGRRPPNRWGEFRSDLADGFSQLGGYTAMYTPVGTVDHYLSCENRPELSYEWSNYRFVAGWVNSSKGTLDDAVLDPFEVEDGWFEILLPSLQLRVAEDIPEQHRARAEYTIKRLHLEHDERVIRQRQGWYELYCTGQLNLEGLDRLAPLIADAVKKREVI